MKLPRAHQSPAKEYYSNLNYSGGRYSGVPKLGSTISDNFFAYYSLFYGLSLSWTSDRPKSESTQ
jgi:hypothetical protein